MRSACRPPRGRARHSCGGRGNPPTQAVYALSDQAPLAGSLSWKSLAAWAPRNGTEAAHTGPRLRDRQGASTFTSTRFDHRAGEAVLLGVGGAHGSHGKCHPTLGHFPRAPGTAPGPWLAHPKAGEARRGFCRETPLHPAEGLGTFPHILPTCTEGHQPPGPAREPVRPGDLQRLSCPGGRGPGVITATWKGRGAGCLRNSEEDRTRSRASLRAASRASGESLGAHGILTAPHPIFSRVCA